MGSAFSNSIASVGQSALSSALQNLLQGVTPGGRLTLTSNTPVMTSDVSNATSVYYTPYKHNIVPIYDGTTWVLYEFTELTNSLSDNTKNPAAAAADKNYDLFVWNDSGTLRLGRGPAWSSNTARGTGAGTTELERVDGRYVNKIAITNGPAAQRGLYVGTIRTDSSGGQVDWELGGNGAAGFLYVWNCYNRELVTARGNDSASNWTYATDTWRGANNGVLARVSFVRGLDEDHIHASYTAAVEGTTVSGGSWQVWIGVGLSSTTAPSFGSSNLCYANNANAGNVTVLLPAVAHYNGRPGLGHAYVQGLERGRTGTTTFYGDNNTPSDIQNSIILLGAF